MRRLPRIALVTMVAALAVLTGCSAQASATQGDGSLPPLGDTAFDEDVHDATVLVVGDSLAHAFGEGMSASLAAGSSRNVTIVNAAIGGCGILLPEQQEVGGEMAPVNPQCNEWPTNWSELVTEYEPDYVYLTTSFWDVAPQILESGQAATSIAVAEVQQRWIDNALTAIDLLTADGAHVFLDDANSDGMHAVQERTVEAADSDLVTLLPLRGQMCDESGCPAVIDGIQVLDDTGHPSGESRDRLARWILNSMLAHS